MTQFGNPYHNGDPARLVYAPFAGRQAALARVGALVANTGRSNGLLFTGWRSMGKTALLHAIVASLSDAFVGVIVSLRMDMPQTETDWLMRLADSISTALIERNFTLSRLAEVEPPGENPRGWFEDDFLPPIFGALRANRSIIIMLDDVDRLIMAVRGGQLPADTFAYLSSVLARTGGLHLILTLDEDYEADVPFLAPLIGIKDVIRLAPLEADDLRWLMTAPISEYSLSDEAIMAAMTLTGGFPAPAQRLGYHLYERWRSAPEVEILNARDVRGIQPTLYLRGEEEYRALWERLTANEQIVLTALSGLHYDDPLRKASAESVQRWLVETETPLDLTTIQATLRALEYRHLLLFSPDGVSIRSSLYLSWLLENARIRSKARVIAPVEPPVRQVVNVPSQPVRREARPGVPPRLLRFLALLLLLVVIANVVVFLLINGGGGTGGAATATFAPTATFITPPAITPLFP